MSADNVSVRFAGIYQVLNPHNDQEKPQELEVLDDLEGEQETVLKTNTQEEESGGSEDVHMSDLQESLLQASKGVSENTDMGYQR
jgi:hypothetical protein